MERKDQRDWKLPAFDAHCPSPIDWARMAAFIDGEGSILINTQKRGGEFIKGFYLRVTIANTDVRLMAYLKETFGGTYKDANTPKYYEGKVWKRCYHWGATAQRGAWILHNCLPYFIMKAEQAQLGIQLQDSMKLFVRAAGRELPKEVLNIRAKLKSQLSELKKRGTGVNASYQEATEVAS